MSDSTPIPAPTAAQINAYPNKSALSGDFAPELVDNDRFARLLLEINLMAAIGLLDEYRSAKSPEDLADITGLTEKFFAKLTRFDRGTTEDPA